MLFSRLVKDPLGNIVDTDHVNLRYKDYSVQEISSVISSPGFIINEANQRLYYFGLVAPDLNLLVEAQRKEGYFEVTACIKKPSVTYISTLLKKGPLITLT